MLIWGAIILVAAVVASLALLLVLDLRNVSRSEWVSELKQWQSLIGAVLGFLGAAGVLVLGFAIENEQSQQRAREAAHAIGLGLALEVERLAVGLQVGRDIGATIDFGEANAAQLPQTCVFYAEALQRALSPATPVYDAVLGQMIDFGDVNLAVFVRFYSFYAEFSRALPDVNQAACNDAAADEIRYLMSQIEGGLGFYEVIARNYDIAPLTPRAQATPDEAKT